MTDTGACIKRFSQRKSFYANTRYFTSKIKASKFKTIAFVHSCMIHVNRFEA